MTDNRAKISATMFIPDQTKTDFGELLGDKKALKKLKSTKRNAGNPKPSVFEDASGGLDLMNDDDDNGEERCNNRKMHGNPAKGIGHSRRPEKRTFRQSLIGGLLFLALSGGLFSAIWAIVDYLTGASLYPVIDVGSDDDSLKKIFFSGEPYVVYCQAGKSKAVPKILIEGANLLPRGYSTAMLNCDKKMGSTDKTVYERFNLDPKGIPAFVVANGEKPVQFNSNSFYNPEYFSEFTKTQAAPKLKEVTNEIQFRNFCTEKRKCVAFGHKGKLSDQVRSAIESANISWRKQRFASIETSRFSIKLDQDLSASVEKQMVEGRSGKQYLSGLCISSPDRSVDPHGAPRAMVRKLLEGDIYYFVKDCMGDIGLSEVRKVPTLEVKNSSSSKKSKKKEHKSEEKNHKQKEIKYKEEKSQYADDGMEIEDVDE